MRPGASEKWQWRCSPPGAGSERNGLLAERPGPQGHPRWDNTSEGRSWLASPGPQGQLGLERLVEMRESVD